MKTNAKKKLIKEATIEEIIFDMSSCEDIESFVLIGPAGFSLEDGVTIMNYSGWREHEGYTLKDTLVKFMKESRKGETYETDLVDWSSDE